MFKFFGLKGQVLELRGQVDRKEKEIGELKSKIEFYLKENKDLWDYLGDKDEIINRKNIEISKLTLKNKKLKEELEELEKTNEKIWGKSERYLADLLNYEKQINELENKLKNSEKYTLELQTRNKKLSNDYLRLVGKFGNYEGDIIKDYLIKKFNLLEDQNAPRSMICLIKNLINEINVNKI